MSPNTMPSAPSARAARPASAPCAGACPVWRAGAAAVSAMARARQLGRRLPAPRQASSDGQPVVALRADDHDLARGVVEQPGDVVAVEALGAAARRGDDEAVVALVR